MNLPIRTPELVGFKPPGGRHPLPTPPTPLEGVGSPRDASSPDALLLTKRTTNVEENASFHDLAHQLVGGRRGTTTVRKLLASILDVGY